ncbi:cupin domain-containing protein [Actibacterium pelagium]|uniref:Transcriptional regulator n=1 Tax=Actibacterium pelagium TaxID=2029103 RepID=A0A917AG90_9RHOB|nr:cupin domain-containing protein [Actibacterium pelagium]GGE48330.1 transcriptional regulator [Actibacterium pelagium]
MVQVIPVNTNSDPVADEISATKLISGEKATQLWHTFSDASDRFHVGHWGSEECEIDVSYSESELCVIVEGRVSLTSKDGAVAEFKAGDAFVIPSGFEGTWKSIGTVKKIYASFE